MSKLDVVNRYPAQRNQYTEREIIRIDLPSSANYVCMSESYLECNIELSADGATPYFPEYLGAYASIKNATIYDGYGGIMEQLQDVNILMAQKMKLSYSPQDGREQLRNIFAGAGGEGATAQTFILDLHNISSLFQKHACLPLKMMNGMAIELELDTAAKTIEKAEGAPTMSNVSYTVSDPALVISQKGIPESEVEALTAALTDRFEKNGLILNWLSFAQTQETGSASQQRTILDYTGAKDHSDCVALLSYGLYTDQWNDPDTRNKFLAEKNSTLNYQFNIDNTLTPVQPVDVSRDWNVLNVTEIENAMMAIDQPVTNFGALYDPSQMIVCRSLAGKNRSLDLANKNVQCILNNSSSALGITFFSYVAYIKTVVIRPGSVQVIDGFNSALAQ